MSIERIYSSNDSMNDYVDTIKREGAVLLRGFVGRDQQVVVANEVLSHHLTPVDRSQHTIPEQFHDIGWEKGTMPPAVRALGERVCDVVAMKIPDWDINSVRAQLYSPGEVGIDWHRDYKRDLYLIAIVSFMKHVQFDVRLASGEVSWLVGPGDLVLMRGALLNGPIDDRPQHRVSPPFDGKRLSVAYRMVADTAPELEEIA